jgi:hypothetical protein
LIAKGLTNVSATFNATTGLIAFEELLMFQVVQQETLTRLLGKKGYSPGRSFWDGEGAGSGDE